MWRSLIQHFVRTLLAAVTKLNLPVWVSATFAHLGLGCLSFSSREILSRAVGLAVKLLWPAGLNRCSLKFNSQLWLDYSRTLRSLSRSHWSIVLVVCFACRKVKSFLCVLQFKLSWLWLWNANKETKKVTINSVSSIVTHINVLYCYCMNQSK